MEDEFIVRLRVEKFELNEKIEKLSHFIMSEEFTKLETPMRDAMIEQSAHMIGYYSCLAKRLDMLLATV